MTAKGKQPQIGIGGGAITVKSNCAKSRGKKNGAITKTNAVE
jgi:hypothetical protein